jgi:hypothetical protein
MQSVSPILIALARRRNHLGSFSYLLSCHKVDKNLSHPVQVSVTENAINVVIPYMEICRG